MAGLNTLILYQFNYFHFPMATHSIHRPLAEALHPKVVFDAVVDSVPTFSGIPLAYLGEVITIGASLFQSTLPQGK